MTASISVLEREQLAASVRGCVRAGGDVRPFLAGDDGAARVDAALWDRLREQVGVGGLIVPEQAGGAGAGFAELAVVLRELGAALAPVPALSSIGMATPLLLAAGEPALPVLRSLADGSRRATAVWPDASYPFATGNPVGVAIGADGRCSVSGSASFVLDGVDADVLVIAGSAAGGLALVAVDGDAAGVVRRSMITLDLTRGMAELALHDVEATLLAPPAAAPDVIGTGLDLALVSIAAEQVGVGECCLSAAVDYAKSRVQFGRPIGSFQAIKHRLVDLVLDLELARSALDLAAQAADTHVVDPGPRTATALRAAASMAKSVCGDAAMKIATESLHVFGGIGFTWDHDAHLYFRRAKSLELLLGDPAAHRVRLAAAVGV